MAPQLLHCHQPRIRGPASQKPCRNKTSIRQKSTGCNYVHSAQAGNTQKEHLHKIHYMHKSSLEALCDAMFQTLKAGCPPCCMIVPLRGGNAYRVRISGWLCELPPGLRPTRLCIFSAKRARLRSRFPADHSSVSGFDPFPAGRAHPAFHCPSRYGGVSAMPFQAAGRRLRHAIAILAPFRPTILKTVYALAALARPMPPRRPCPVSFRFAGAPQRYRCNPRGSRHPALLSRLLFRWHLLQFAYRNRCNTRACTRQGR